MLSIWRAQESTLASSSAQPAGTTLVIGARGSVGRHVLTGLLEVGADVRASARNPSASGLPADVPVVAADLTDAATLRPALDGVSHVFLYATASGIEDFTAAALDAGVEHVVLLSSGSVLLDAARGNAITEEHRDVELALAASGLAWTPVRPLVLANNALNWKWTIRAEGLVRMVYPEAPMAPIHERDIAHVALAALASGSSARGDLPLSDLLTGPELLTQRQQVHQLAAALGRPVEVVELSEDEGRDWLGRFMPLTEADAIVAITAQAAAGGSPATDTAQRVLGRRPISFAQWASEHTADFA